MSKYHSITCTEHECDPGVDGGPACPFFQAEAAPEVPSGVPFGD